MLKQLLIFLVPALALLVPQAGEDPASAAQVSEADGPAAEGPLAELAWLAGRWTFEQGDEYLEETWSPPRADAMVCSFYWARAGHVWLYELVSIELEDGVPVFRLRHFERGLGAWEGEDTPKAYALVEAESGERKAVFENPESSSPRRFEYEREDDRLIVRVIGDGGETAFAFERAPN